MHGQLGQADVHGVEGHLGVGDVAEGGAAGHVRPVGVALEGDPRLLAEELEERGGDAVRGIVLGGVVLDDHAAVELHAVVGVGELRVVGMDGVGVVAGEEEAMGHLLPVFLPLAQGLADPLQGVPQEGGRRALLGLAADFLVVKEAVDGDGGAVPGGQEGSEAGEGALQVVEPRGGEQAVPLHALLGVVEGQVRCQEVLLPAGESHGQGGFRAC